MALDKILAASIDNTISVNAASYTIGSSFIANTTGAYHTGVLSVGNTTTQHILPAANITYDIGTATNRYTKRSDSSPTRITYGPR